MSELTQVWTTVCRLDQIEVEGGVAALVDGEAVAIFRTHDDQVHAISNYDPFSRASVLARGIVGTRETSGSWRRRCTSRPSTCAPGSASTTRRSGFRRTTSA